MDIRSEQCSLIIIIGACEHPPHIMKGYFQPASISVRHNRVSGMVAQRTVFSSHFIQKIALLIENSKVWKSLDEGTRTEVPLVLAEALQSTGHRPVPHLYHFELRLSRFS